MFKLSPEQLRSWLSMATLPTTAYSAKSSYLPCIAVAFVALLMISNTIGGKIVSVGPFVFSAALAVFPATYIFGDILTEVYGYRATRQVIWLGFAALILMSGSYYLAQSLPSAPDWGDQEAFTAILGFVPRLVVASITAFFVGEFCNSYVLSKMKVAMAGQHLWMRTIGSTVVGEGVDTAIFTVIAFYEVLPLSVIGVIILTEYTVKVLYEICATPLTYAVINGLKRAEGMDVYDRGIDYNPFRLSSAVESNS